MSAAITLDVLRRASTEEFPVIDLGGYIGGEAGATEGLNERQSPIWFSRASGRTSPTVAPKSY